MSERGELVGSCKTLTINIEGLRRLLRRRGPWPRTEGLRTYHDRLVLEVAKSQPSKLNLTTYQ